MSEESEQIALIERAQLYPITRDYLFHVPNGGFRNRLEGLKLKKMGVKRGIPDLFLAYPVDPYHGLFIEMKCKRKNGSLTQPNTEQLIMLDRFKSIGYHTVVVHSWEIAWKEIQNYLGINKN